MLLPQTAEYALRALAQLALLPRDQPVRTQDLSRMAGIPVHYLSKILRRLVQAGLLGAEKGHHGGFWIAKPLARIRFADVLEALDLQIEPDRCAFGWGKCNPRNPCPLHPAFSVLNEGYLRWVQQTTLADIAHEAESGALALPPAPNAEPPPPPPARGKRNRSE